MVAKTQRPTLTPVADDEDLDLVDRGQQVRQQRVAFGMSRNELADRAHLDRQTLRRVEEGVDGVREISVAQAERALAEFDAEVSPPPGDAAEEGVVRFKVEGVYGARSLVVEGPVENIADLEASVDRIMRRLASNPDES